MLEELRKKNADIKIYSITDEEFRSFGRIIEDADSSGIIEAAKAIPLPQEGSAYTASVELLEGLEGVKALEKNMLGELPAQAGYCCGYSSFLNAAEWHSSNEINIAVTPLVLILGHLYDLVNGKISSDDMKAFYVPAGAVVEVYSTTLHFCPCQAERGGFGCVVILPEGTNVPLDGPSEDPLLFRKNKWIIAHNENSPLIERGVMPGISGRNTEIKF